jgi:hypothetical protein
LESSYEEWPELIPKHSIVYTRSNTISLISRNGTPRSQQQQQRSRTQQVPSDHHVSFDISATEHQPPRNRSRSRSSEEEEEELETTTTTTTGGSSASSPSSTSSTSTSFLEVHRARNPWVSIALNEKEHQLRTITR